MATRTPVIQPAPPQPGAQPARDPNDSPEAYRNAMAQHQRQVEEFRRTNPEYLRMQREEEDARQQIERLQARQRELRTKREGLLPRPPQPPPSVLRQRAEEDRVWRETLDDFIRSWPRSR